MDLDTLLDDAAPSVAPRTPELAAELARLAAGTRPDRVAPARRLRRRLATAGASAFAVGALGIGGAAATGLSWHDLPGVFSWTSEDGQSCGLAVTVEASDVDGPDGARVRAAMEAATAWAASFDLDAIDVDQAEEQWLDHLARISADHTPREEIERKFREDRSLESHAVAHEVSLQLDAFLREQGISPSLVNPSLGIGCDR